MSTCVCGHDETSHYNARPRQRHSGAARREPCHHRGKHDTRCDCRNFRPGAERATSEERGESDRQRAHHERIESTPLPRVDRALTRTPFPANYPHDAGHTRITVDVAFVEANEAEFLSASPLACELADAWVLGSCVGVAVTRELKDRLDKIEAWTNGSARRKVRR